MSRATKEQWRLEAAGALGNIPLLLLDNRSTLFNLLLHFNELFCLLTLLLSDANSNQQPAKKKTWMLSATFDQVPPSEPSDWPFLNRNNRRPSDEDREMTADESQRGGDTRRVPKLPSGPVLCSWKVHQRSRSIHVRLPSPQAGKEEWRFHKSVCACVCAYKPKRVRLHSAAPSHVKKAVDLAGVRHRRSTGKY